MEFNLYKVNDGDNVINKVMSDKFSLQINLKRDVDITNPQIVLLDSDVVNFSDFNYAEIVELKRFYFINDIQRINSKMIQMSLRCDVLETYKADVLASNARFYRNIKTGDYYNASLDTSINKTSTKYPSNKGMDGATTILTSVGA